MSRESWEGAGFSELQQEKGRGHIQGLVLGVRFKMRVGTNTQPHAFTFTQALSSSQDGGCPDAWGDPPRGLTDSCLPCDPPRRREASNKVRVWPVRARAEESWCLGRPVLFERAVWCGRHDVYFYRGALGAGVCRPAR